MAYSNESLIATAIERLNDKMDKIDEKVDSVQSDVNKFVVLFEKLAHIEKTHDDSNKRVHHRIDEIEKRIEKTEERQNNGGCPTFKSFRSEHDNELRHNLEKIKNCEEFKANVETKINDMEMKPAKRFDGMITHGLSAFIGALVLYIMAKIGLSK